MHESTTLCGVCAASFVEQRMITRTDFTWADGFFLKFFLERLLEIT